MLRLYPAVHLCVRIDIVYYSRYAAGVYIYNMFKEVIDNEKIYSQSGANAKANASIDR